MYEEMKKSAWVREGKHEQRVTLKAAAARKPTSMKKRDWKITEKNENSNNEEYYKVSITRK